MKRTTLVSAEGGASQPVDASGERGSLKVFFSYAPCSGTTAAMLDEVQGLVGTGRDVYVVDAECDGTAKGRSFDLDQVLKRRPDVVVLENLAMPNPSGARNRTRYQDAEELLRAGIDVYATLRVTDLQNEQDRVRALGIDPLSEPVPDYMLYGARQLEFVDIDPEELVARATAAGREVPRDVLNELRVLALRCVSEYAASAGNACGGGAASDQGALLYNHVVAVVWAGEMPGRVLLEATRLAAASRAELEVVCVRRQKRSSASVAAAEEAAYAALEEQVEAMGSSLVTLYGDDEAEVVRDYLRTQGASDVVMSRRPRPHGVLRRMALLVQAPFEDRVARGLTGVGVHLVANEGASGSAAVPRGWLSAWGGVRGRDLLVAAAAVALAFVVVRLLQAAGVGEAVSYLVFLSAFVATAALTRSYIASVVAVVAGCLMQDYFFIRSYLQFSIDHRASLLLFVAFVVVSAAISAVVVGTGRAAGRAAQRERRTQALFDLNRSLLYVHGTTEVVDIALDAVVRLFGRSAALYLGDPFVRPKPGERDRRAPVVRTVAGDVEAPYFDRLTEQAIAHWVFVNGEPAGNGTDTHGESDVYYLPLASQEQDVLEGVLAVSASRSLSLAERSFLGLVANQIMLALERQSLAAKHRADLRVMHVTSVRDAFVSGVVASSSTVTETVHAISDLLLSAPDDDSAYRDALARAASDESSRGRLMTDRIRTVLEMPASDLCDVRAEVAAAVDEVREGLAGKVISLEPGDPTPPVAADAALVRIAARLVLEASTSYVGKCGKIQVSVTSYPDRVNVVIADDRPSETSASRAAAYDLSTRPGHEGELAYESARASLLLETLRDRAALTEDPQAPLRALCRAMRLPEAAARTEGDRGDALNRLRVLRFDRLEYGLYMAALAVRAHGGTIKQRYRLGGGAVVTFTIPRD